MAVINIPAPAKTYNEEQLMELWYRYYAVFTAEISFQLIYAAKKDIPWLRCNKGMDTYTDHNGIMIGLQLLQTIFQPTTEEEFILYVLYLVGHEIGHIKHTPKKPWTHGMNEGTRQLCILMSEKFEGKGKRRFVKETDIDNFLSDLKKTQNIDISKDDIKDFCHGIQNSLEDGREERLEAKADSQFFNRMKLGRGKAWLNQPIDEAMGKAARDINDPNAVLAVKTSQILSLATTSFYQKGFFDIFDDDNNDIYKNISNDLLPLTEKAVLSPTCRQCMDIAIEIEKLLVDDFIEAAKTGNLKKIIIKIFSDCGLVPSDKADPNGLSRTEKVQEINGEFPIFEQKNDDNEAAEDRVESAGCVYNHTTQRSGLENKGCRGSKVTDIAATEKAIKDAMKDAAAKQSGLMSSIVKKKQEQASKEKPYVYKSIPVVPGKRVKEKSNNVIFEELTRVYDVKLPMSPDLQLRANNFKQEIEDILRSKAKTLYDRRSGQLDSGSIYKLFLGELNIFKEESTPHDFDGCCYLLQDNSGSMGYGASSKRQYASEANAVIEEGFKELMPLKITAFDASDSNFVTHEIIKDFDEVQPMNCSYNFMIQGRGGCCNRDGYDIRIATQELLERNEKNKLLIVLSDGTPSASGLSYETGVADVTDAVAEARENGIKVVGMYFASCLDDKSVNEYKKMYGEDIIATTPDRIELELVKLLKDFYFNS